MAEYRLTNIIVALICVGMLIFGFMTFAGTIQKNYTVTSNLNANETINKYDRTGELVTVVNETDKESERSGNIATDFFNDIAGKIFGDAYKAFKTTKSAFNSFGAMADDSANIEGIKPYVPYLKAMVWVIILLGIIMTALLGREI